MEPVFMMLSQSAAALAIDASQAVQEVPYPQLRERMLQDGQVLEWATVSHHSNIAIKAQETNRAGCVPLLGKPPLAPLDCLSEPH
jgi:hypothetical protein